MPACSRVDPGERFRGGRTAGSSGLALCGLAVTSFQKPGAKACRTACGLNRSLCRNDCGTLGLGNTRSGYRSHGGKLGFGGWYVPFGFSPWVSARGWGSGGLPNRKTVDVFCGRR